MKTPHRLAALVVTAALALSLLACAGVGTPPGTAPQPESPATAKLVASATPPGGKRWPYEFVATKTEDFGHHNVMDLYAFSGEFDPAELKAFCRERKEKSTAKVFYYAVIFDTAANARFPGTPFTAEYGISEEKATRHIRALYGFNRVNGYSHLQWHPDNLWSYRPNEDDV